MSNPDGEQSGQLRVALVGYGLAGRVFHAPLLAAAGFEIVSVVTADPDRAAQAMRDLPRASVVPDVAEIWRRASGHDLVVVAAANQAHLPIALEALDAGLPVVVDKPLAIDSGAAQRLVEQAEQAQVPLSVFHNRRWDSDQLTLRRLMQTGELGEVFRLESRFERWRPQVRPGHWREVDQTSGGILLDLGSHLVDQALALLGPVARVDADASARRGAADDDCFLVLHHTGGVVSHLSISALAGSPGPRLRVLGTGGAFVVEALDGQEDQLRAGLLPSDDRFGIEPPQRWGRLVRGEETEPVASERGQWASFYPAMGRAIRGPEPVPVDPADAVRTLRVLEAARQSAATGRTVVL